MYFVSALALLLATRAVAALSAEPPAPPEPAPAPAPHAAPRPDGDLDAQLEAARKRLEQAAHEVARLSSEMSGSMLERVMPFAEGGHAIIGVQLESAPGGARVSEVSPGGPAAEAGVHVGDVIVAVNGAELKEGEPARQVLRIMRGVKPDTKVSVRVLRDGRTRDFTLTAQPSPGLMASLPELDLGPALD